MAKQLQVKDKTETNETIKIVPFRKDIKKTSPHKHNNYSEIIYLTAGSGYPEGFIAIIKKAFIEKSFDNGIRLLLTKLSSYNCLSIEENTTIRHLFEILTEENKIQSENTFHIQNHNGPC